MSTTDKLLRLIRVAVHGTGVKGFPEDFVGGMTGNKKGDYVSVNGFHSGASIST